MLQEYLPWAAERLITDLGIRIDDPDTLVEKHQQAFRRELPNLLSAGGRLLVARLDGEVFGMGALKPVSADIAEIERMYVRPPARGKGIGRALLEQLLADARRESYRLARLETLTFMTAARALYRSLGFRDTPMFGQSETAMSGLEGFTYFMELPLQPANESGNRDGDFEIYKRRTDGARVITLTNDPAGDFTPDWQPRP